MKFQNLKDMLLSGLPDFEDPVQGLVRHHEVHSLLHAIFVGCSAASHFQALHSQK